MGLKKFLLILFLLFSFSLASYAETSNTNSSLRWKLSSPQDVSNKANSGSSYSSSPYGSVLQDPMVNSMIGGFANMMQQTTGSVYNAQEVQKQQIDYTKQQEQYMQNFDKE